MQSVDLDDVRWTNGFWADQFDLCHNTMIPNLWRIFSDPKISHAYTNFRIAAGLEEGNHHGPKFNDGDFYKWLEAAAFTYAISKDAKLDRLMDQIIDVIARSQRDDGYLHTPVLIVQKHGNENIRELQNQLHFETYNIGHLLTTACIHHRATGKTSLLAVAIKAAEYLIHVCEHSPMELARITICPSHYMGIIDLYRVTHDQRYLELAKTLIDIRALNPTGTDHNQDRIAFREQTTAVGHAVRANYLYAGAADVYLETGDSTLLNTLEQIWRDVVYRKMYVTGATGALYDGASPDGSRNHSEIQLVHQAYGRPYQLPNITAYNETCATIGNALLNWRMLQITGEARFADVLELALYNGILAGISLDGKQFFYTNPLRTVKNLPFDLRWSRERKPYISSFCCPPNVVRAIAEVSRYAYSVSENSVCINLFGSNELDTRLPDGSHITLRQKTDYPWNGHVTIEVQSVEKPDFAMNVRIPEWANNVKIQLNRQNIDALCKPGSYFSLQKSWTQGDTVEINFPMPATLIQAHPLIEELRNQVAVKRGPLVYCLESTDLPDSIEIDQVMIPRDIQFHSQFESDVLGGIVTLKGTALAMEKPDWTNHLYRELQSSTGRPISIQLIPYYAYGNRDASEMSVWMPLR
ncbi:MAG: glycoside hydrolase family 127 protein [Candidatus Omnitrophota bacterium]|nr:MAG: glycoside hydrolase family 127 protein [Candidatus Omnitrophota bacterium]